MNINAHVCRLPDKVMMVIADAPRVKPRANISLRNLANILIFSSAQARSYRNKCIRNSNQCSTLTDRNGLPDHLE